MAETTDVESENIIFGDFVSSLYKNTDFINPEINILILGKIEHAYFEKLSQIGKIRNIETPGNFNPNIIDDKIGTPGDLDFADCTFDLVLVTGWLEKVKWLRWSIQEIYRVLKTNGEVWLEYVKNTNQDNTNTRNLDGFSKKVLRKIPVVNRYVKKNNGFNNSYIFELDNFKEVIKELDFSITMDRKINSSVFHNSNFDKDNSEEFYVFKLKKNSFDIKFRMVFTDKQWLMAGMQRDFSNEIQSLHKFEQRFNLFKESNPECLAERELPKNIIVLSPHPDDELIGAGGTIIKAKNNGAKVNIVQMTNGELTAALNETDSLIKKQIRSKEALKVAQKIGANLTMWNDIIDGTLLESHVAVERLHKLLIEIKPDAVFLPFYNDPQPDHFAANKVLYDTLKTNANINLKIFAYEVWSMCPYNTFVNITDEFEEKRNALSLYRSALRSINYIRTTEWFAAYHGTNLDEKNEYVEVFRVMNIAEFIINYEKFTSHTN